MRLSVPILPSKAFTWSKNNAGVSNNIGVAYISDLSGHHCRTPWSQMYDDACDIGLGIRSGRTDKIIYFSMGTIDKDHSGEDIAGWNFTSECGKYKILIIND